jgi:(2Fe-2S) ferredoxin
MFRSNVLVCGGTGCTSSNSEKIIEKLHEEINAKGLEKEVNVVRTGCFGLCALGPIMIVYPEGAFYSMVTPEDVPEIVEEHLLKGRIVKRLLYKETVVDDTTTKSLNETQFYEKQMRVALRNCGVINPEVIDEYIALDGYQALGKGPHGNDPAGAGHPDDARLRSARPRRRGLPDGPQVEIRGGQPGRPEIRVCNADEGDPGAFMDRSMLEGDPHSVIEAMTIAGYAIGATQGYVYVRAEYPIAVKRLQIAIDQAREYGLLGKNIFDSGFDFDIELRLGAGAFVCGEETALMTSIEGKRGEPRCRPRSRRSRACSAKPTDHQQRRNVWPTSRRSSSRGRRGSAAWAPRKPRAPRCSRWAARSTTPASSRFRWEPRCARSSKTSAAASRAATSSRPPRPAARPAAASRRRSSTRRSTTTRWRPSAP